MNYLKERVAYLKGLAEGMNISESTNEGKLLKAIIDVIDDVALAVDDLEEVQEQINEQLDSIDEDLSELESIVFGDDNNCDTIDSDYDEEDTADEEESEEPNNGNEFDCPHCGMVISLDEVALDEESTVLNCPHCNKDIEIEWECDYSESDDEDEDEDE